MRIRFLLFVIMLTTMASATAGEFLLMNFELVSGANVLHRGKLFITEKTDSWSKGLRRSYLKLRCEQKSPEGMLKTYSTVDLFDGLTISHQLVKNKVNLTVTLSSVKPRLIEIRALSRDECRDMSPIITSQTRAYSFAAAASGETLLFSDDITFKYTLQPLVEKN